MHRFLKWREAIAVAPDPEAVSALMAEYVSGILPSDLGSLPPVCQRALESPGRDIQGSAVLLLQEELRYAGDPGVAALLHEIAHTFIAATTRLGQLHGRANSPAPQVE